MQKFTVRLDQNYKQDIGRLQLQFNHVLPRRTTAANVAQYTEIAVKAPPARKVGQLSIFICNEDLYARAFRNAHATFYLPTYNGLKYQDTPNVQLPDCNLLLSGDSYADLNFTEIHQKDPITPDAVWEAARYLSQDVHPRPGHNFKEGRKQFGYLVMAICEAIRFRTVRDDFHRIFNQAELLEPLQVEDVMVLAKNWSKNSHAGHSHSVRVPNVAAEKNGSFQISRLSKKYIKHSGLKN